MKKYAIIFGSGLLTLSLALVPAARADEDGATDEAEPVQVNAAGVPVDAAGVPVRPLPAPVDGAVTDQRLRLKLEDDAVKERMEVREHNGEVRTEVRREVKNDGEFDAAGNPVGATSRIRTLFAPNDTARAEEGENNTNEERSEDTHRFDAAGNPLPERTRVELRDRLPEIVPEQVREMLLNSDATTTRAETLQELKQKIEERRAELRDRVASTSPVAVRALEHASDVSIAVHALLAARDLLGEKGGIGDKVSEIAKQVNDSLATTTAAEARVEDRGFLRSLFFGGDREAADQIREQVTANREKVAELRTLLDSASTTEDVRAELKDQIEAMRTEQERLESVADTQSRRWGIFSWRFFGN